MKVTVTFQQMKRELLGFWQLRLAKSKDLSVLQHLPNRHMENQGHNTVGSCWNKHSTWSWQNWHLSIYNECWEAFSWIFSLGSFTYTRHNWEIFCFLPSKTANSWELTVSDGCTVRSCKPAWSCQKIKYLETHMGLNQTERQPCKRTAGEKKWKLFFPWLHGLGISQ